MPIRVFTTEEREELRIQMLDAGFALIKQNGMTHTSVSKITKAAGLGTSTFYNFFPSKERFVLEIMEYQRDRSKQWFNDTLAGREKMSVEEGKAYFRMIILSRDSIYQYLTLADEEKLRDALPANYVFDPEADRRTLTTLLDHMEGIRPDVNWKVAANLIKMLAMAQCSKDSLHQDVLPQTLEAMFGALFGCLFGA